MENRGQSGVPGKPSPNINRHRLGSNTTFIQPRTPRVVMSHATSFVNFNFAILLSLVFFYIFNFFFLKVLSICWLTQSKTIFKIFTDMSVCQQTCIYVKYVPGIYGGHIPWSRSYRWL